MGTQLSLDALLDPYHYGLDFQQVQYLEFFCSLSLAYYAIAYFTTAYKQQGVVNKARNRRALRDAKKFTFPAVSKEKTEKILLSKDVTELIQLQITQQVTSVDIVSVYSQRCHTIGRQLNLVTEEYYYEALLDAAEKDKQLAEAIASETTDKLGKLHGIPISIKDHIEETGRISTAGCSHFADHIG